MRRLAGFTIVAILALSIISVLNESHVAQSVPRIEPSDLLQSESKTHYYVITKGANLGNNILCVPIAGNETAFDAICHVESLSQLSVKWIWIARPGPVRSGGEQILPVDWDAITRGGSVETNWQVLPGDRVFIVEDESVSAKINRFLTRMLAPLEHLPGITCWESSTVHNTASIGAPNRNRSD